MAGLIAVLLRGLLPSLLAQDTDAERLRRPEERLTERDQELEAHRKAASPPPAARETSEIPLEAFWKDGLRFRSRDKAFEAHVGGRVIFHARTVLDRPDEEPGVLSAPMRTVPDSFFVRQARLETGGVYMNEWAYKVQADFATGQFNQTTGIVPSNVSGTLRDAYVEWRRWDEVQIRIGQFYEPVSQEDMTSSRFIDFVERSPMNRLMPGREIGLQVSGTFFEKSLSYHAMVSGGGGLLNDQGRAVADRDDEKEVAGLLRWTPFLRDGGTLFKGLRLGLGATVGSVDEVPVAAFDQVTTELSILYLDVSGAGTFDGRRWRVVPQLSWAAGPATLRGEYLIRRDELDDSFSEDELESEGWYVAATVLLTGEEKKPEDRIVPAGTWGAVELAARVAQVSIDNAFESGLASPAGNSEKTTTFTVGLNWWITRNVRLSCDAILEKYEDPVTFEAGREEDSLVGFLFRAQIDF